MRLGLATVEANRREYLFVLACETLVLLLALLSMRWLKRLFFGSDRESTRHSPGVYGRWRSG